MSRNPKDVAVSFYHFHKMAAFLPEFSTFREFLHRFLEGTRESKSNLDKLQKPLANVSTWPSPLSVCYGSWFDHVKDWTSQRRARSSLLHVTYEEMSLVKEERWSDSNLAASLLFAV